MYWVPKSMARSWEWVTASKMAMRRRWSLCRDIEINIYSWFKLDLVTRWDYNIYHVLSNIKLFGKNGKI